MDRRRAGIVQVLLSSRSVGFERANDGLAAGIESSLARLFLLQGDQHLVVRGRPEALDARVLQAGTVERMPYRVVVRRVCELYINIGAAAKLHSQRNAM